MLLCAMMTVSSILIVYNREAYTSDGMDLDNPTMGFLAAVGTCSAVALTTSLMTVGNRADLPIIYFTSIAAVAYLLYFYIDSILDIKVINERLQGDEYSVDIVEQIFLDDFFQQSVAVLLLVISVLALVRVAAALTCIGDVASYEVANAQNRASYVRAQLGCLHKNNAVTGLDYRQVSVLGNAQGPSINALAPKSSIESASLESAAGQDSFGAPTTRALSHKKNGFLLDPGWRIEVVESPELGTTVTFMPAVKCGATTRTNDISCLTKVPMQPAASTKQKSRQTAMLGSASQQHRALPIPLVAKSANTGESGDYDNADDIEANPSAQGKDHSLSRWSWFVHTVGNITKVLDRCPTLFLVSCCLSLFVVGFFYKYYLLNNSKGF